MKLFLRNYWLLLVGVMSVEKGISQTWSTLAIQPNNTTRCLVTDTVNNVLYASGDFTAVGTLSANHIARFDGLTWDSLACGLDQGARCMAVYNNELYVGGYITASGSTPLSFIAKWDGTSWQSVGGGMDGAVFALTVCNGELYAGGFFTHAGGVSANYIAKWNGTSWASCGSGTDGSIWALTTYNNEVYAGGFFTTAGGINCKRIAKYNGTTWAKLGPGFNNGVYCITAYGNQIIAGGYFTKSGTTPLNYISQWDGSQWSSLTSGLDDSPFEMCQYSNELYVAGAFTSAGANSVNGIARWNGYGWNQLAAGGGNKNSMSVLNGELFVGGSGLLNLNNSLIKWNCPIASQPNAEFIANDTIVSIGANVKFTNQSTGSSVTSYWICPGGNPSISFANDPIINYPTVGNFTVTLIASTSVGSDTLVKSSYIHVDSLNHPIGYGVNIDYVPFLYENVTKTTVPANLTSNYDTCVFGLAEIYYYKPLNYDSINSPIIWGVHGLGGNGSSPIGDLQAIADRRNAMIISITMDGNYPYCIADYNTQLQPGSFYYSYFSWYPQIFKQIYSYVLSRELRTSIPVHLIGFSGGGQFVTRYMLIRQGVSDSIPIRMAVSTNPFSYTFCTDTFLNIPMYFPGGLLPGYTSYATNAPFECNEHVFQYYNENYGVLIGTGDTQTGWLFQTDSVQGANRYERAQNFYAFSDSNAVTRGTSLKWPYVEIPGVAHNQTLMYNTKANITDSATIAETLLFDTPYHPVPSLAPVASFHADTTEIFINGTVNFYNTSVNSNNYVWDFGDATTSTLANPSHIYTVVGTYSVELTANSLSSCENTAKKCCYINVKSPVGINEINTTDLEVEVYPNPVSDILSIDFLNKTGKKLTFTLFNLLGEEEKQISFTETTKLDIKNISAGIYFYKLMDGKTIVGVGKVFKL